MGKILPTVSPGDPLRANDFNVVSKAVEGILGVRTHGGRLSDLGAGLVIDIPGVDELAGDYTYFCSGGEAVLLFGVVEFERRRTMSNEDHETEVQYDGVYTRPSSSGRNDIGVAVTQLPVDEGGWVRTRGLCWVCYDSDTVPERYIPLKTTTLRVGDRLGCRGATVGDFYAQWDENGPMLVVGLPTEGGDNELIDDAGWNSYVTQTATSFDVLNRPVRKYTITPRLALVFVGSRVRGSCIKVRGNKQ